MREPIIEELAIPATLDGADGSDFIAMNDVRNRSDAAAIGTDELSVDAAAVLPRWHNPYEPKRLLVARIDGRIVARAIYETRTDAASTTCWLGFEVLPEYQWSGLEQRLHARTLEFARADGRSTCNFYAVHRVEGDGDRLESPTGFGSVPADDPLTLFLLGAGYRLGQVARVSKLSLPADAELLRERFAAASDSAGAEYRVVHWIDRTPDEWVSGVAELNTRMSTDAPIGEMAEDEDPWDDARVRADDELAAGSPEQLLVAGVVHVPSGRLVGFNELSVPVRVDRPVGQEDTLVLSEHRGHRLGMLLKVANLLRLEEVAPGHPSVITFNAEENRHMLSVNEAVGFVPVAYEGGWVLTL